MLEMPVLKVIKNGIICNSPDSLVLLMHRYCITGGIPALSLFFNTGKLIFEIRNFIVNGLCAF